MLVAIQAPSYSAGGCNKSTKFSVQQDATLANKTRSSARGSPPEAITAVLRPGVPLRGLRGNKGLER